jgi:hypothetical protein
MNSSEFFNELKDDKLKLEKDIALLCDQYSEKYYCKIERIEIDRMLLSGVNKSWYKYNINIDVKW